MNHPFKNINWNAIAKKEISSITTTNTANSSPIDLDFNISSSTVLPSYKLNNNNHHQVNTNLSSPTFLNHRSTSSPANITNYKSYNPSNLTIKKNISIFQQNKNESLDDILDEFSQHRKYRSKS